MEALKKQASKLREQVAKQQQTIMRHLGQLGHESVMVDEAELQSHQQLEALYLSTRAAKHFQKDIARGIEAHISTSRKEMQIARKLAKDCCKYGNENESGASPIARAASNFGASRAAMEDERETMLGILGQQVSEPLRAMVNGAPLEDARRLTHRYDRMRQELEAQFSEVIRRQSKFRDSSAESLVKLKNSEAKLTELKSSMLVLGKEAIVSMLSVEEEQQQTTYQKLLTMVDAERSYHRNVIATLEKLHSEMILEEQSNESSLQSSFSQREVHDPASNGSSHLGDDDKNENDFIAKVIHPFDAQGDGELSLELDDHVVVRQAAPTGWSEGESKGKCGWFPSAYVEKIGEAPAIKLGKEDLK
ncbi:PREDICTED: SH3 domain-containing protein 2-like [Ipomoea nil]|uniref:SH3 domain-containing protein 2-like n=1 Tax=Ipomoea nil TaxID=35883 RepID=UPI0009014341|nr:PREDICTED: SH3 domain-containing protein 2-like [Ipomoea nil]XP_019174745.1 PREDICTED: SH3 domain-containing protein 2-like [Ipomoea nil]